MKDDKHSEGEAAEDSPAFGKLSPNEKIFTLPDAQVSVSVRHLRQLLEILLSGDATIVLLLARDIETDASNPGFVLIQQMNQFLAFCGEPSPSDHYN